MDISINHQTIFFDELRIKLRMIPYRSMLDKGKTRDGYVNMLLPCWYDIENYTVDNLCRLPNYDDFVLRIRLFIVHKSHSNG